MRLERTAPSPAAGTRSAASISIAGGGDFARSLALGQIVRGRVLRAAPGGRWLVDFDGRVKVAESAAPLRADEVVVGRVVALGEQVELQRVHTSVSAGAPSAAASGAATTSAAMTSAAATSAAVTSAATANATAPGAAVRPAGDGRAAIAARVLSKLGVERSREALRAVDEALREGARGSMFPLHARAIRLETRDAGAPGPGPALAPAAAATFATSEDSGRSAPTLPALLARLIDVRPGLGRRLLNLQGGGALGHRVGTLPLLVDGSLRALDLALFDQSGPASGAPADGASAPPRHGEAVFAVTTRRLGRVEVRATIAGDHVRVRMSAPDDAGARELARHAAPLAADLEARAWRVDELAYRGGTISGAVPRAVLGHLVAPGSVSVLA
ncbi:MAG: flagellar hook-length control protein FliK [Burkholderiaceae bacterium]